jgi:hypothetical protein
MHFIPAAASCGVLRFKIKAAILKDDHFFLADPADCPFDLCFQWEEKTINVELKDFTGAGEPQSDYVASTRCPRSPHLFRVGRNWAVPCDKYINY